MKKYTFTCKLYSGENGWNNIIVIIANSKEEALEKLSKKYNHKVHYYSSNIKVEDIKNIETVIAEEEKAYNNIHKDNRIALAMLIGGVGGLIAGNQMTINNTTLGSNKKMETLSIDEIYDTAKLIVNHASK